ncbi:hypothetical protein A8M77_23300 [Variovorax sp. JS1663]|nr:hypothetical protein A8M77_23300 [Variovorax sp. JS1663]
MDPTPPRNPEIRELLVRNLIALRQLSDALQNEATPTWKVRVDVEFGPHIDLGLSLVLSNRLGSRAEMASWSRRLAHRKRCAEPVRWAARGFASNPRLAYPLQLLASRVLRCFVLGLELSYQLGGVFLKHPALRVREPTTV